MGVGLAGGRYCRRVPGHRSLLPALVAAATLSATLAGTLAGTLGGALVAAPGGGRAGRSAEEADPLQVSIDSLNPSVIPEKGTVTLTGTVTNVSDETWEDVNLYPVLPTEAGCRSPRSPSSTPPPRCPPTW